MVSWKERIAEAERVGFFTNRDIDAAWAWSSCAVGEQKNIEKDAAMDNEPLDAALALLGGQFGVEVEHGGDVGQPDEFRRRAIDRAGLLHEMIGERSDALRREAKLAARR